MFDWFRPSDFPGVLEIGATPAELKAAISKGECVLFAGEGLSRTCGMPVWSIFVVGFADWLATHRLIERVDADCIHTLYRDGKLGTAMARLKEHTEDRPSLIVRYAEDLYLKPSALSRIHEALQQVPFSSALTPNLDELVEMMLRLRPEAALTPEESEDASARLAAATPVFLKLRGTLARPETVSVWLDEGILKAAANPAWSKFFAELLNARTMLMVGVGLREVEMWMTTFQAARPQRPHYALVEAEPGMVDRAKALHKKYNLLLVQHPPKDTALTVAFLQNLVGQAEQVNVMED